MTQDFNLDVTPPNKIYRSKYACDEAWIKSFLQQVEVGHVATRWDDQPFITPVLFFYDEAQHEIYFHTNIVGRVKANAERHTEACFEASRMGKLLPSNIALEFGMQYESVVVFGKIRNIEEAEKKRQVLYDLIKKYFPDLSPGKDYCLITDRELKRTAVIAIRIVSWSGKRNWKD